MIIFAVVDPQAKDESKMLLVQLIMWAWALRTYEHRLRSFSSYNTTGLESYFSLCFAHTKNDFKSIFKVDHVVFYTDYLLSYTAKKLSFMYSFSWNSAASVPILKVMCLWAIYIVPGSVYIFPSAKKGDRWWEYINRSQTHECGNWGWDPNIPFLGIFVSNFGILSLQCKRIQNFAVS